MRAIQFIDLLMLRCIMDYERDHSDASISVRQMMQCANDYIASEGISGEYTFPIKSIDRATRSIDAWRKLGVLTDSPGGSPGKKQWWFQTTAEAHALMRRLRADWRKWPKEIPITGDPPTLAWDQAKK